MRRRGEHHAVTIVEAPKNQLPEGAAVALTKADDIASVISNDIRTLVPPPSRRHAYQLSPDQPPDTTDTYYPISNYK